MLNQDALTQLKQLKRNIHDSIERLEGNVRGSRGRYGFFRTDDGREIFLPPEEMDKVLPGDRVSISVVPAPPPAKTDAKKSKGAKKGGKSKDTGAIEKLIDSPLKEFTGRYTIQGKGHFVIPDVAGFNRYIFLPPSERKGLKPGDLLRACISRHPIKDGRVQGRVLERIGAENDAYIECRYAMAKYGLDDSWDAESLPTEFKDAWSANREDLLKIPFVTIDSADTRDVDDALYAKENEDGWRLFVAIADPAAYIQEGSKLDIAARARASSVYLPGKVLPMLPESISNDRCSLLAEHDRPALVCRMLINTQGDITEYDFISASVRSHAKLSYSEVNGHLHGERQLPEPSLLKLHEIAGLLAARRAELNVAGQDYPDYRYLLDDNGKIEKIRAIQRNDAHRLVEECMIAANRCAADCLKNDSSVFVSHLGLRPERVETWSRLIAAHFPDLENTDAATLSGHIALTQAISKSNLELPLATVLSRMQQRARLSAQAGPHHGLGFECYTTFTSPLRKYNDLMVHRALHAKIASQGLPAIDSEVLTQLQKKLDANRAASNEVTENLGCQYLAKQTQEEFDAVIVHVSGHGFKARLLHEGIEGFVDSRDIEGKLKFDADLLRLSGNAGTFELDQKLRVVVKKIDLAERRIDFKLAQNSVQETPETAPAADTAVATKATTAEPAQRVDASKEPAPSLETEPQETAATTQAVAESADKS